MLEELYINTSPPTEIASDYEGLRKKGIDLLQTLSSRTWTDFNIHDPGLTILEYLCYGITDLSLRVDLPVEDILAVETHTGDALKKHFFTAKEILPTNAITINDYRKLLIDLQGVKNAWIRKSFQNIYADLHDKKLIPSALGKPKEVLVEVKGFYDVLLELEPGVKSADQKKILENVQRVLQEYRNLCEDFKAISLVEKQEYILCAEIEVDTTVDPFDFLAELFFRIQMFIAPPVYFYPLEHMFAEGFTADEIFEGPLLQHGFIKQEELLGSELRSEIYLSDIMGTMMDVKGIRAINDIVFNPLGLTSELPNKWIVDVEDGKQPVVNVEKSNVVLYKNNVPFRPNKAEVRNRFEKLMKQAEQKNDQVATEDISFPTGRYRNLESYYSLQNHFPKTYGISQFGLPESSSEERKVLAKQLKGYLLHFEQLLANHFSQLSHVRSLFSIKDEDEAGNPKEISQTYFSQLVTFLGAEEIYAKEGSLLEAAIQEFTESKTIPTSNTIPDTNFFLRRNRFLDHLLARVGENFGEYLWMLYSLNPTFSHSEIIRTKENFLQDYPKLSVGRFTAYNYREEDQVWGTENVSGLEKRIARLLGFKNYKRRNLASIQYDVYQESDSDGIDEFRFRVYDEVEGHILLSSSTKYPTKEAAIAEMSVAIQNGMTKAGYEIKTTGGKKKRYYYNLIDPSGEVVARHIHYYPTLEAAEASVQHTIDVIHDKYSMEGMFVVEHHLLLPSNPTVFMPICVEDTCETCEELDPYSFRISVVLPAYAPRFMDMDFRNYVERVIRVETPSHILPKICWISQMQMQEFEQKYKAWLALKADPKKDQNGQALADIIDILTRLKNVYPPAKLEDCSGDIEKQLFILNQKALGTLNS